MNTNKAKIIFVLLLFFTSYCEQRNSNNNEKDGKSFPKINIIQVNDTLSIGDVFEARIFLSDSSFLFLTEPDKVTKRRIFPIFKINGNIVNNKSDTLILREVANENIVYAEYPYYREIECAINFPHPIDGEGSVELQRLITYIVSPTGASL